MTAKELEIKAYEARLLILEGVHCAKAGHPGGSLSCVDALTTLYFDEMKVDTANPRDPDRDRFVMSKGHCAPALYAVLAVKGFFPKEDIRLLRSIKGHMSGHPDMVNVPGVDMSTGSLGQGISAAVGMALAAKHNGKTYRTYAIMGDGEIEEGQCWEAFMAAAKWKLDNLCAFIDVNGLQIDGATADVMPSAPLDDKLRSFGWNVIVVPGHDYDAIRHALATARITKGAPTMILLETTKGKGVSYMENSVGWHGKAPNDEQYEIAVKELTAHLKELGVE
ncbi:MAG: transketolase [Oscillospiraceae bacterium]|nr:transketolase [Oscillospiraceae bacterium]